MKTPEEIKRGLGLCADADWCNYPIDECPYANEEDGCKNMMEDSFAYIQQLEAQNAELKRERDALINDLYSIVNNHVTPCFCCKIFDASTTVCEHEGVDCFVWRGVPEKEDEHGT